MLQLFIFFQSTIGSLLTFWELLCPFSASSVCSPEYSDRVLVWDPESFLLSLEVDGALASLVPDRMMSSNALFCAAFQITYTQTSLYCQPQ